MNQTKRGALLACALLAAGLLSQGAAEPLADTKVEIHQKAVPNPVEHLYVCILYGPTKGMKSRVEVLLRSLKAKMAGDLWTYTNPAQRKDYVIHFVRDTEGLTQALYTPGAHIAMVGHANYGMGAVFATDQEMAEQTIPDIRYLDDDRMFTTSSPWIGVKVYGVVEHQSFPNWQPRFKDGTSGIMPYDFGDPRGDPPYNYYISYQVPGDPTHYPIETVANSALERFPSAGRPAWYAADGSPPDPGNPDHRQYYITNRDETFELTGAWQASGYLTTKAHGDDHLYTPAGTGDASARWNFQIPRAGRYNVSAWWPAFPQNTTSAAFTVYHGAGSTTVKANQRTKGGSWSRLGSFAFAAGEYSVVLSNRTAAGVVVADAVRITAVGNAKAFDTIVENTTSPRPHFKRKTILFRRDLKIEPEQMRYARMYIQTCNSGLYFLETFHRGVTFYTVDDSDGTGLLPYLKAYLQGKSDREIWSILQRGEPIYDYYDFSRPPAAAMAQGAAATAAASEPKGPALSPPLSLETQSRMRALAACPTAALLERLAVPEFLADEALLQQAVVKACQHRQTAAIALALGRIASPTLAADARQTDGRTEQWTVAKAIQEAFPDAAAPRLVELFDSSGPATKGSVVRVLGNIDGGTPVEDLLLAALDDKSFCADEGPESEGDPLRLCDVAYNQSVQRYGMDGVLRAIGPMHRLEVRDHHIGILRARIERAPLDGR